MILPGTMKLICFLKQVQELFHPRFDQICGYDSYPCLKFDSLSKSRRIVSMYIDGEFPLNDLSFVKFEYY